MIKLNTLRPDSKRIIGQLYINSTPTHEVLVVNFGRALSLNSDRSWGDVSIAGNEFYLEPRRITINNMVLMEVKDVTIG